MHNMGEFQWIFSIDSIEKSKKLLNNKASLSEIRDTAYRASDTQTAFRKTSMGLSDPLFGLM